MNPPYVSPVEPTELLDQGSISNLPWYAHYVWYQYNDGNGLMIVESLHSFYWVDLSHEPHVSPFTKLELSYPHSSSGVFKSLPPHLSALGTAMQPVVAKEVTERLALETKYFPKRRFKLTA